MSPLLSHTCSRSARCLSSKVSTTTAQCRNQRPPTVARRLSRSSPRQPICCKASDSSHETANEGQQLQSLGLNRAQGTSAELWFASSLAVAALDCGDGTGGGLRGGGGGGDGGGGGSFDPLYDLAALDDKGEDDEEEEGESGEEGSDSEYEDSDDEEQENIKEDEELALDEFFVDEVVTEGLPSGEGVPTRDELLITMQCQPGFVCNRSDLSADLRNFMNWGIFQDVQARVSDISKDGKSRVIFTFIEYEFPAPKSCDVVPYKGTKLALPASVVAKVRRVATEDGDNLNAKKMFQIRKPIEDWYSQQGYTSSYVTHIDGMESGKLKVKVLEGKVNSVNVVPVDADGNPTGMPGNIPEHVIMREVPFERGQIFNGNMLRKCLRDVFGLGLFESMSVNSRPSSKDESRVDVDLMVKERPVKTADLDLEWGIVPTASGRPGLATWVPGGSLTWENGNFMGTGRQLAATATTANFLNPSEDLGYQLSYRHPDLRGAYDPKRAEFNAAVFNTRKLSPVFAPGPTKEEVPAMFVDRLGLKAAVSEQYSRNSKGSYGFVLEQVASLDDTGALAARGTKPLFTGEYDPDGPPASLSATGKDLVGFLQSNFTRDTTYFQSGMQLGERQVLQVEQGLGVGTNRPVFNRHRLSWTRFQPLEAVAQDSRKTPKVVVLHAGCGGCIGDVLPYDLFTLGGPYSVRGYNVGELASARYFVEGAAEVRLPLKGRTLYAFAETASDLGSSQSVLGNPTLYYKRPGSGSSMGLGIKLGAARLECATEGFAKPSVLNIRFGERF